MSVLRRIHAACLGFLIIIALLGLLAHAQLDRMGQLAIFIYDHDVIGMSFAAKAQVDFHRLTAGGDHGAATATVHLDLTKVTQELDVAIERAGSQRTRSAGDHARALLGVLPEVPTQDTAPRLSQVDQAIALLVKLYTSDALLARNQAEQLAARSTRAMLVEVGVALGFALAVGWFLSQALAPPLIELVGVIGRLTAGDFEHEVAPRLAQRGDEIGLVARATLIFEKAMRENLIAGEERAAQRARAEMDSFQATQREAEMAGKSALLATMSHEIRTPMNGVAAIADLLVDTELTADQSKLVRIIQQSADGLLRVINDILDFSKLEANQMQIEQVPFLLDDMVDGVIKLLSVKAREKGLALQLEGNDLEGMSRLGDPLRLRQILLNLLGNAIKFTAEGSVTLRLAATQDSVRFDVIDTGIGIPADKVASLFQPYAQADAGIARQFGGTGLGLSISKTLVDLMQGQLEVASELGRGSRFSFALDLPGSAVVDLPRGAAGAVARWRGPHRAASAARAAVILCAEDNPINRDVLARVLDSLGFNYDMTPDGGAALATLDRRVHGLVVTDAQMPVLDGWQLVDSIRQDEAACNLARLPILMATANALAMSANQAHQCGIDAVLLKPLRRDQLEAALLAALPVLGELRMAQAEAAPEVAVIRPGGDIDLGVLIELVGDQPDDLRGMLDDFQGAAAAGHAALQACAVAGDGQGVARHAHSIKGAALYAGAHELAAICATLEQQAKTNTPVADFAADLAGLDAAIQQLPAKIAAALCELAGPPAAAESVIETIRVESMPAHDGRLRDSADRRAELEQALRTVLKGEDARAGRLYLLYQPCLAISPEDRAWSGARGNGVGVNLRGFEALLRWDHPRFGSISPGELLGAAESCNMMGNVSDWVLRAAIDQIVMWESFADIIPAHARRIAVNVSANQLSRPQFAQEVAALLQARLMSPDCLTFEVREAALTDEAIAVVMSELRQAGVRIAVDDFGAGQLPISLMRQMPADEVKLDRRLIGQIGMSPRDDTFWRRWCSLPTRRGFPWWRKGLKRRRILWRRPRPGVMRLRAGSWRVPLRHGRRRIGWKRAPPGQRGEKEGLLF